ncbi:hypothetical protein D3C76_1244250 [compost metagenome]
MKSVTQALGEKRLSRQAIGHGRVPERRKQAVQVRGETLRDFFYCAFPGLVVGIAADDVLGVCKHPGVAPWPLVRQVKNQQRAAQWHRGNRMRRFAVIKRRTCTDKAFQLRQALVEFGERLVQRVLEGVVQH